MSGSTDAAAIPKERPPAGRWEAVATWIREHDESWLFVASYLTLAIVLSLMISFFWLAVIVAVHLAFELVRQSEHFSTWPEVVAEAIWEVKLDIVLVVLAVVIGVYMDFVLGVLGLRSAGQLGAAAVRAGSRAPALQSAIRGILLSVDEALQVLRSILARRRTGSGGAEDGASEAGEEPVPAALSVRQPWKMGDWCTLGLLLACVVLLLLAPNLTGREWPDVLAIIAHEMHPWP